MPFEPSAGLEGFEEEKRLWCRRYDSAWDTAARGAEVEKEAIGVGGVVKAAHRTEDENMSRKACVKTMRVRRWGAMLDQFG